MGGEGTAGLLSLLIREGELDRGEVEVGLLTSCGARGIQGEAGDTHMGTEANRGRVSNKFRDGVRDTHRNGDRREIEHVGVFLRRVPVFKIISILLQLKAESQCSELF